jgi:hypothetical protein
MGLVLVVDHSKKRRRVTKRKKQIDTEAAPVAEVEAADA